MRKCRSSFISLSLVTFTAYRAPEVCGGQTVFEGVHAVDEYDRNLRAVATLKFGVGEDVDLLESVKPCAAGIHNLALCVFAEVAARLRVEKDVWFGRHHLFASGSSGRK